MHNNVKIVITREIFPEMEEYYNQSGFACVDSLDQTARHHTNESAPRRLPGAVFFHIID